MNKCLFATVLTYPAPSANYRGENEENRSVIQKITDGRFDYAIMSPEAMRNALREMLRGYELPSNRERLHPVSGRAKGDDNEGEDKQQLAVRYSAYPDPERYVDDFFFGYLLTVKKGELTKLRTAKGSTFPLKRDSVLRMNLAKSLRPYRYNAVFTQSPQFAEGNPWTPGGGDAKAKSALLHRETVDSAFQYPFAFNLLDVLGDHLAGPDVDTRRQWFAAILRAIAELTGVAGNHARSLFHMAPASIVIRLTDRMAPGFNSYGFQVDDKGAVSLTEVTEGIKNGDYPGGEFYLGGVIVKQMSDSERAAIEASGVRLFRMGDQALAAASKDITGIDFLAGK